MASDNIKDNFLYLAPVANSGLLSYIKHSSIGNVPAETITTLVALIQLETPLYKHCTQGCVPRPKGTQIFLNRIKVFIMFTVQLQTLPELPASKKNMFPMSPGHCDCVQMQFFLMNLHRFVQYRLDRTVTFIYVYLAGSKGRWVDR